MNDYQKLIDEYSADYCHFLEAAYGKDMMSEGGAEAIELMFTGKDLKGKTLLDVGCGLGGVAFYLAEHHGAFVTGLELNPRMIKEASKRTPEALKNHIRFSTYIDPPNTPFPNDYFDIVYSKGVLTHVKEKAPLFKELHRILKPTGQLIIDDWLSPSSSWGTRVQTMCDTEDLTLYAETEESYIALLQKAGFRNIQCFSRNPEYSRYNQDITDFLKTKDSQTYFIKHFGEKALQEAINCYQLIADAIKENELLIRAFEAEKI